MPGSDADRRNMRVFIAGGNGFLGRRLTEFLVNDGHDVVWLSHRPGRAETAVVPPQFEIAFDPHETDAAWREELSSADAVVNLSGHPIASRWNDHVKHLLRASRIDTNRALVDAISDLAPALRPSVMVTACGVGIYGNRGDQPLGEAEPAGDDWLARLAAEWEAEGLRAAEHGVRAVSMRTGLTLGDEGLLPRMALPMRLFVGGPVGSGRQWLSWIHQDDVVRAYRHVILIDSIDGPVNIAAPGPLPMREFARELGHVLHRPSWFPALDEALRDLL